MLVGLYWQAAGARVKMYRGLRLVSGVRRQGGSRVPRKSAIINTRRRQAYEPGTWDLQQSHPPHDVILRLEARRAAVRGHRRLLDQYQRRPGWPASWVASRATSPPGRLPIAVTSQLDTRQAPPGSSRKTRQRKTPTHIADTGGRRLALKVREVW